MEYALRGLAATFLCLFGAANACANVITLEPDDYAPGTYVSRAVADVTLWTFRSYYDTGYVPTLSPVYVAEDPHCTTYPDDCAATTGTRVFQDAYGGIDRWGGFGASVGAAVSCFRDLGQNASTLSGCDQRFNVMLMEFTSLTDFVQIDGAFWAQDDTYLYAFDDAFNVVGFGSGPFEFPRCSYAVENPKDYCRTSPSIHTDSDRIRYAIAGGWSNGTSLDRLTFSVPEPGTLALLSLGLASLGLSRRRKAN